MGMSINAKCLVGLSYEDLEDDSDELEEWLDDGVLEYASPYYDSAKSEWFCGIEVDSGLSPSEFIHRLKKAGMEFEKLTGQAGKVFIVPNVT